MGRLPTAEVLKARSHLRVNECALLYGRGAQWWKDAFDRGDVAGYRDGKSRHPETGETVGVRYIEQTSASAYVQRVGDQRRPVAASDLRKVAMEKARRFARDNMRG